MSLHVLAPLRVLLVEDNEDDIDLLRIAVERSGARWELSAARSITEALAVLRGSVPADGATLPELVLLDWKLPGTGGSEMLREIRADARLHRTTVLVLTSSDAPADVRAAFDLHANAYLRKPEDFGGYKALVAGIEAFWHQLAVYPDG